MIPWRWLGRLHERRELIAACNRVLIELVDARVITPEEVQRIVAWRRMARVDYQGVQIPPPRPRPSGKEHYDN